MVYLYMESPWFVVLCVMVWLLVRYSGSMVDMDVIPQFDIASIISTLSFHWVHKCCCFLSNGNLQ